MTGKKILVVDDDEDILLIVQTMLTNGGYSVALARNGKEAIDQAIGLHPDLIVLDVMMPDLNGFEVCQRLRADARTHDVPVLMLTALDEPVDRTRGFLAGIDDYLAKPFDRGELLARVRRILQRTYGYGDVVNMLEPTATAH